MARQRKSKNDITKYAIIGVAALVIIFLIMNVGPTGKFGDTTTATAEYTEYDDSPDDSPDDSQDDFEDDSQDDPQYSHCEEYHLYEGESEFFEGKLVILEAVGTSGVAITVSDTKGSITTVVGSTFVKVKGINIRTVNTFKTDPAIGASSASIKICNDFTNYRPQTTTFNCASVTCTPVDSSQIECSCK
jgi:hypothetical protein